MEWAQIAIRKAPPAGHETKDRLRPQLRNRDVHENQVPAWCKQFVKMPQRGAQIAHRMKHVGPDDEIKRAGFETLLRAWLLEVKNFVFHSRKPSQLLHGAVEKYRGDITEDVGMQIALDERQYVRRQATGTRPDFEDSQSSALWQ